MTVWHSGGGGPATVSVRVRKDIGGWYEVASDVLHASGGLTIDMAGRQSELARIDNGVAQLVLNNAPRPVEFATVSDLFARTESNGWGTADSGQLWSVVSGGASSFSVGTGEAGISLNSVNVARVITLPVLCRDLDLTWSKIVIAGGAVAATAPIIVNAIARYVDSLNYLTVEMLYGTDDSVTLRLRKLVAGTFTVLASTLLTGVTGSGVAYSLRLQVIGDHLRAKAWNRSLAEPAGWQVEAEDSTFDNAGGVGMFVRLETGNTNGTVAFAFDGLTVVDPLALAGRYTPGYQYAPIELTQGMQLEVTETVGGTTYDLFAGTLQQPEAGYGATANEAVVSVAAVDQFGELEQGGRTFVSTLGEYIRYAGGSSLVAYWPMNDPPGSIQAEHAAAGQGPLTIQRRTEYGVYIPGHDNLLEFGAIDGPPMDDTSAVVFHPLNSEVLPLSRDWLVYRGITGVTLSAVEAVAVSLWYRQTDEPLGLAGGQAFVAFDGVFQNSFTVQNLDGVWTGYFGTDAGTGNCGGAGVTVDTWQLLTCHLVVATGVCSFWVDELEYTVDIGGASTGVIDRALVDAGVPGTAACHMQIYAGPSSVVNRALHLAQYAHATNTDTGGLRFQRSDERFTTLCGYAGVTPLDVDMGTAWMSRARLAGQTFPEAVADAARTEQGRAFVSGDGTATFHSRNTTRYDPPAPVSIPSSWLRVPLRIRQDSPYTVAEVSTTEGGTARESDPDAARQWRYSETLDSISPDDGAHLAAWIIDYYGIPRPRFHDLTLRLNNRSVSQIQTILGVTLGSRITITGLPTGFPTGANELIVEGVRHEMDAETRQVIWSTTPVIGAAVGELGPWFELDVSTLGSTTDLLPF